jgi:hypothetical protein
MSKLTEIEKALRSIDPAGFQRICDAYLYARGYRSINPIGVVIGADKVKRGTPDTLVPLPNGNYAFAEYTTQQTGVVEKFLDDMSKCFDESKTGIPANRIQEFVACHTSVLDPGDEHKLVEEGRKRGCLVTTFGLGPIAHDLLQRFPGLAREFLNVELDTGQILTLDAFVAAYGKSAVATPLDTEIRFREEDIKRGLADLEGSDLIIVAGPAGVGKSRLALELCRRYADQHPEVEARAVLYRGLDLFNDTRTYFATPGLHLIFVDDANRVSGFGHILSLLHEQREDRRVKIVATVRDYALDKVREETRPYGSGLTLMLNGLKDEQIRDVVTKDFGILNYEYYERIVEIAQGNPRLAVMAARIAKTEQTLRSLANVSALYDEYFRSIGRDIADLQDLELLRAAGIIALFRHVDRKNEEQMRVITRVFQIPPERFWPIVERLHESEVVDLYEDEVVRLSDQVLATYLFHLAFFGQKVLDPGSFFHPEFFPKYRSRLFDALNPAASAFDAQAITNAIRPFLKHRWVDLENTGNEQGLLELVNSFGAIDETATLTYLRDRINALAVEPIDVSTIVFKSAAPSSTSLWDVLDNLRDHELPIVRMALALTLDLAAKRPSELPHALHVLIDGFGMQHTSHLREYEVQTALIETLWDRRNACPTEQRPLFDRLFLMVAEPLLHTEFRTHHAKGMAISILTFEVPVTPALTKLRQTIWAHIPDLLSNPEAKPFALELIRQHTRGGYQVKNKDLLATDAAVAIPALDRALDPSSYLECAVVQDYLHLLKSKRVTLDKTLDQQRATLQSRFAGPTVELATLLLDDVDDLQERAKDWREFEKQKETALKNYVASRDLTGLEQLLADCVTIYDGLKAEEAVKGEPGTPSHKEWQFKQSIGTMMQAVAERDPSLFVDLVDWYLAHGEKLELEPYSVVPLLIKSAGPDRAHGILTSRNFVRQKLWLTGFYVWLPDDAVTDDRLRELLSHYAAAAVSELLRDLDFLAKFECLDTRIVPKVVAMLVEKAQAEPRIGFSLAVTFDGKGAIGGRLRKIFGGSPEDASLLKRAYFAASVGYPHFDYNATSFSALLDIDPGFGAEWVDWRYATAEKGKGYLSRMDEHRDYSDIWRRDDYMRVMRDILERVRINQKFDSFSYGDTFVTMRNDEPQSAKIRVRQREFFETWINEAANDISQMRFVFARVVGLPEEERRALMSAFLSRNQKVEDFQQLRLEPDSQTWSGSQVPLLEKQVAFLESLLPLFDRIALLDHRQSVQEQIAGRRKYIEEEKKRDFLER